MRKTLKFVLFFLGLGIIALGIFLFIDTKQMNDRLWFFCANLVVAYCIVFGLVFFNGITRRNVAGRTALIVVLWRLVPVFAIAAVVLGVLVKISVMSLALGLIVDLALLFVMLFFVYFGVMAKEHVEKVTLANEKAFGGDFAEMKENAVELGRVVSGVADMETRKKISGLAEDIGFVSPSQNARASQAERDISATVLNLVSLINDRQEEKLADEVGKLEYLLNVRKGV